MIYISHRINTILELKEVPIEYGIEIDLRDFGSDLILEHEPFLGGEKFENFIKYYNHKFIILNIKSERIEFKIKEILNKYNIENYFFLDSSFPMIYTLSNGGEKNIAIRFSEYESIESVLKMKNKVVWVWIDSFENFSLNIENYTKLKENNFKICVVSPELQKQPEKLKLYRNYIYDNNIIPDMICTKIYNINKWKEKFK